MTFPLRPVWSRNGVVAGPNALTAAAGLRALAAGGRAADAAVAMAAMSSVTMPQMCGLGGDAFAVVYEPDQELVAYNGSGPAPAEASLERYRAAGHEAMPSTGWWSVAVPGALGVYLAVHDRHGRLPLRDLWEPAIERARHGFAMDVRLSGDIAAGAALLAADTEATRVYLAAGRSPAPGTVLRNPDLARSLELIVRDRDALTNGEIAERIAHTGAQGGALLRLSDLADAAPDVGPPLAVQYRGATIGSNPLPSQGVILLEMLNLLEDLDVAAADPLDPNFVHLLVEIKKLAFADRNALLGDPRFVAAPVDVLLSREFARARRADIMPTASWPSAASVGGEDTTSFVAVDGSGEAVSFIHSISALWGSGVMPADTGILLNNRAGRSFVLDTAHPNCLAPGKRPMHTLHAYVAVDHSDGRLLLAGNTPGGDGQPQWNLQVLTHLLDRAGDAMAAVAAPRWTSLPGTDPQSLATPSRVALETGFPPAAVDGLRRRGHVVDMNDGYSFGSVMLARSTGGGAFEAAADPRDGGQALAL
jgi:gamma-glutamyltranspeptidase/glutathione hydrolase